MRAFIAAAFVAGLAWAPAAHADVHVTISEGFVSLEAKDATVRQILDEWARVGQTKIVNAERISGAPLTLHLVRVPEAQALDIVLRSVAGYMAAPRAVPDATVSRFDRILVMPTSNPPRVTAAAAPPQTFPPPALPVGDDVDMDEPGEVPPGTPVNRGPIFPQYPNPNGQIPGNFQPRGPVFPPPGTPMPNVNPNADPNTGFQPAPQNAPFPGAGPGTPGAGTMPVGVSTPGMMVAPPQPAPGAAVPEPQD